MSDSIGGKRHAKLSKIYTKKECFKKSIKDQCEYDTVDGLLDSGSDTFSIGGYKWVIESLTIRKVTVVGYNGDTVK